MNDIRHSGESSDFILQEAFSRHEIPAPAGMTE